MDKIIITDPLGFKAEFYADFPFRRFSFEGYTVQTVKCYLSKTPNREKSDLAKTFLTQIHRNAKGISFDSVAKITFFIERYNWSEAMLYIEVVAMMVPEHVKIEIWRDDGWVRYNGLEAEVRQKRALLFAPLREKIRAVFVQ